MKGDITVPTGKLCGDAGEFHQIVGANMKNSRKEIKALKDINVAIPSFNSGLD